MILFSPTFSMDSLFDNEENARKNYSMYKKVSKNIIADDFLSEEEDIALHAALSDPVELKKEYGDRLSFDGTIGIQTTLPFGTTEDVDREVKHMIETVGKGGGLIIAPTHVLEPEVPLENIMTFLNAVDRYGHYV